MICILCGLEAGSGSIGGPNVCAWCDCGGPETRFRMEHKLQVALIEHQSEFLSKDAIELARLRLVAADAKALLDNYLAPALLLAPKEYADAVAVLAESLAAWERGEEVDEEDLGK